MFFVVVSLIVVVVVVNVVVLGKNAMSFAYVLVMRLRLDALVEMADEDIDLNALGVEFTGAYTHLPTWTSLFPIRLVLFADYS